MDILPENAVILCVSAIRDAVDKSCHTPLIFFLICVPFRFVKGEEPSKILYGFKMFVLTERIKESELS
jgi:hypothetical protein